MNERINFQYVVKCYPGGVILKKYLAKSLVVVVAMSGLFALSNVTQVQAKSGYRITKTKNYSSKTPFYNKGTAYMWNASHTKKILNMKNHPLTQWYRTKSVIMKHGSKKAVYYKLVNVYKPWNGYVWRGNLVKGYGPKYSGHYRIGYFKLNRDLPTTMEVDNQPVKVTLPSGTVFRGATNVYKQKTWITLSVGSISNHLLTSLGIHLNSSQFDVRNIKLLYSNKDLNPTPPSYLTPISAPNFLFPRTTGDTDGKTLPDWANSLYIGKSQTTWGAQLPYLRTTTDGYVEYYGNITGATQGFSIWGNPLGVPPTASQQILDSEKSGNTLTLYYANHMEGLQDNQVTHNGRSMYQLIIQKQSEPVVVKNYYSDGKLSEKTIYEQYLVGGQPFHNMDLQYDYEYGD